MSRMGAGDAKRREFPEGAPGKAPGRTGLPESALDTFISMVARNGVRAATLRDIASAARMPLSSLMRHGASKEQMLGQAFAQVVAADRADQERVRLAARRLGGTPAMHTRLMWTLVQPRTEQARERQMVLAELMLQTGALPSTRAILRQWVLDRQKLAHDILPGHRHLADILALIQMAETPFAPACLDDPEWRLMAALGLEEAAARLGGHPLPTDENTLAAMARHFYLDPVPVSQDMAQAGMREQIVVAAAGIIADGGLAAVTNRAVAERANCSIAATTYHFARISDLMLTAVLHTFARARQLPAGSRITLTDDGAGRWIAGRHAPSMPEKIGTRAMAEIALAAARNQVPPEFGPAIRRQRGTITQAHLEARGHNISRSRSALAAHWFTAIYLLTAAIPDFEQLFDLDAQALLISQRLFGFAVVAGAAAAASARQDDPGAI